MATDLRPPARDNALIMETCVPNSGRGRPRTVATTALEDAIVEVVSADAPVSVRQVFYRLVARSAVEKTDAAYGRVGNLLLRLRREGRIRDGDIHDGSRACAPNGVGYGGPDDVSFAEQVAGIYRRDAWTRASRRPVVVVESRSAASVVDGVCREWGVDLWPLGGWSSESMLFLLAQDLCWWLQEGGSPLCLYFGDCDPAGRRIGENAAERLGPIADRNWPTWAEPVRSVQWQRIAVTDAQAADDTDEELVPCRQTIKEGQRRLKGYPFSFTVELEAIPAPRLRALLHQRLSSFCPTDELRALRAAEQAERQTIRRLVEDGALSAQSC